MHRRCLPRGQSTPIVEMSNGWRVMRLRMLLLPLIAACVFAGPTMAAKATTSPAPQGFFASLFGAYPAAPSNPSPPLFGGGGYNDYYSGSGPLYPDEVSPYRVVPAQFRRQTVSYPTSEAPGTIVIDSRAHFLYFILGDNTAIRYGVGVGR